MPLKHIDDLTLQEIAQNEELISGYETHLNSCVKCRNNLEFYKSMFPLLAVKLEGDFSPDFAANVISQVTFIEERMKRIKSVLSFALILCLSIVPFILFPESLSQITILGDSFTKFFGFIRTNIPGFNFSVWSIVAVVLLIAIIQIYDYVIRDTSRKKRFHS